MTEVWVAEEYHGYNYVFSTREKADKWLEKELAQAGGPELFSNVEDNIYDWGRSIYAEGELVGKYERIKVDEIE